MQDYLKTIYRLEEDGSPASTQDLADSIGVSPASATSMIKKMAARGLLTHQPYYGVTLTPTGREVAESILRHHRLLELYLAEALGFGSDQVHAEAERLEHVMSAQLGEQIDRFLGRPTHDPHGSRIPSGPRREMEPAECSLDDLELFLPALLLDFPNQLREQGLVAGECITLLGRPHQSKLHVRIGKQECLIEPAHAVDIRVQPISS